MAPPQGLMPVTETSKSMGFVFILSQDDDSDGFFFVGGGMWKIHDNPNRVIKMKLDKNYTYNPLQREISAYHSFSWGYNFYKWPYK